MNDIATSPPPHRGNRLIQAFLNVLSHLVAGRITIVLPDNATYDIASDGTEGPHARIFIRNFRAMRRLMTEGDLGFVESYLDGDWDSPDLSDVIELAALNHRKLPLDGQRFRAQADAVEQREHEMRQRLDVAHPRRAVHRHRDVDAPAETLCDRLGDLGTHVAAPGCELVEQQDRSRPHDVGRQRRPLPRRVLAHHPPVEFAHREIGRAHV